MAEKDCVDPDCNRSFLLSAFAGYIPGMYGTRYRLFSRIFQVFIPDSLLFGYAGYPGRNYQLFNLLKNTTMNLEKTKTVAFTGHRSITFKGSTDNLHDCIRSVVTSYIVDLYKKGYDNFLSGMAEGFDMLAAEAVLSLQGQCPCIRLIPVIPYRAQSQRFTIEDRKRYAAILAQTNDQIILSENYFRGCFTDRDRYMVSQASIVLAYWDGRTFGGTYTAVCDAQLRGKTVFNLCMS